MYYLEETEYYDVTIKKVNLDNCEINTIVKDYNYVVDSDEKNYIYLLRLDRYDEKDKLLKYDYVTNKIVKNKTIKLNYEGNDPLIKCSIEHLFDAREHKYIINYNKSIDKYELYEDGELHFKM